MNKADALKLCDELQEFVNRGPGANAEGLERVDTIVNSLRWHSQATTYLNEKARNVGYDFHIWFSPRKWKQYGNRGEFRSTVLGSIWKLKGAIETGFGPR